MTRNTCPDELQSGEHHSRCRVLPDGGAREKGRDGTNWHVTKRCSLDSHEAPLLYRPGIWCTAQLRGLPGHLEEGGSVLGWLPSRTDKIMAHATNGSDHMCQLFVALPSALTELDGLVNGVNQTSEIMSMLVDIKFKLDGAVCARAPTVCDISQCRGLGRAHQRDAQYSWIQDDVIPQRKLWHEPRNIDDFFCAGTRTFFSYISSDVRSCCRCRNELAMNQAACASM